jgi:hypothetical protein
MKLLAAAGSLSHRKCGGGARSATVTIVQGWSVASVVGSKVGSRAAAYTVFLWRIAPAALARAMVAG